MTWKVFQRHGKFLPYDLFSTQAMGGSEFRLTLSYVPWDSSKPWHSAYLAMGVLVYEIVQISLSQHSRKDKVG